MNQPLQYYLKRQAQAVKKVLDEGTPREFTTITVTDGIAMGHHNGFLVAEKL